MFLCQQGPQESAPRDPERPRQRRRGDHLNVMVSQIQNGLVGFQKLLVMTLIMLFMGWESVIMKELE